MKKKNKDTNVKFSRRIVINTVCIIVVFSLLLFRIGWIQFVNGAEYKQAAYNRQTINKTISPKRGTIYDSTGKSLAMSADVDTVTINPTSIKEENKEKVAQAFSDIFGLDYNETLEKVKKDSSYETIIKKVEKEKITLLQEWMAENKTYAGINIDADTKRYYPYNNLASHLIGFCGTDNQGLYGIEATWDTTLTGIAGKITTSTDSLRQTEIPDSEETYIPAENGSDIYLTIDYNVQNILEKYLKQAVEENNCKRGGSAIIMNPSTGDILAMASYPDYNLNTPFEINVDGFTTNWDQLTNSGKLGEIWRNRIVSSGYEPGSTFKIITTAIALEEELVQTDVENDFICTGSQKVANRDIHCWKTDGSHGVQSLRLALQNSCNPAFMQLGQRIGARTFYKYLSAFGLLETTGAQLDSEQGGVFYNTVEDIGATELATMSFGQRFTVTPLQLITAVSAIANDGVLMQPRIVKQIVNTDTDTVTTIEPVTVRQVLSKETCNTVKDLLESVVTKGTGRLAAVKGYSVGGKTGTSEPPVNHEEEGYTASYIAISPTSNTQVVALVILYDPQGDSHQGGQVAGPVVSQILSEVLPHLKIPSDSEIYSSTNTENNVILQDIRNKTVSEAEQILQNAGLKTQIKVGGNKNEILVTDQVPKPGINLLKNSTVCLYTSENDIRVSVEVPNLKEMSASQATSTLRAKNLNISIEGSGVIVSQDIPYGTSVEEGTVIKVTLKNKITDAH